jgi:hypothetical protein
MVPSTRARAGKAVIVALVMSLALVAGGCGGSDGSDDASDEQPARLTGTVAPTTEASPRSTTTTTESASTPDEATIPGAVLFLDPEGVYTIEVSPAWREASGTVVSGVELWYVGTGTPGFGDNINVLDQVVGPDVDLQGYLDISIAHLGGLELIDSGTVTGAYGQELGYIEYRGMVATAPVAVHALATFVIADGKAILATLTSTEDTAVAAQDAAGDYLLTLMPTGGITAGGGGSNTA